MSQFFDFKPKLDKKRKYSIFDPFSTGIEISGIVGYMSSKEKLKDVTDESWLMFDRFLSTLPRGAINVIASELNACASKAEEVYHDSVVKAKLPLSQLQKAEMKYHHKYDSYVAAKTKQSLDPIDVLSISATTNNQNQIEYIVGASYQIGPMGLAVPKPRPIEEVMKEGSSIAADKDVNASYVSNPIMEDYLAALNDDVKVADPIPALSQNKITINEVSMRSMQNAFSRGRSWGDASGFSGNIKYDPTANVEFFKAGPDLTYTVYEPGVPKRTVVVPDSSKFVDQGLDIHRLGASKSIARKIAQTMDVYTAEYSDSKARDDFYLFVKSNDLVYKNFFNYSWISQIKQFLKKENLSHLESRYTTILARARYRYLTSGDCDWVIDVDLRAEQYHNYGENIFHAAPNLVKKIFGYWNFSRIFDPHQKLNRGITLPAYAKSFLAAHSMSPRSNISTFVIEAFEHFQESYSVKVTARNLLGIKTNAPSIDKLGLNETSEAPDFSGRDTDVWDEFGKIPDDGDPFKIKNISIQNIKESVREDQKQNNLNPPSFFDDKKEESSNDDVPSAGEIFMEALDKERLSLDLYLELQNHAEEAYNVLADAIKTLGPDKVSWMDFLDLIPDQCGWKKTLELESQKGQVYLCLQFGYEHATLWVDKEI